MKKINLVILLSLSIIAALFWRGCSNIKITFKTKTTEGTPLGDVVIETRVFERWKPGENFGTDIHKHVKFATDSTGTTVFKTSSRRAELIFRAHKEGYYWAATSFESRTKSFGNWEPWNPTLEMALRPKLNPIPLIAKNVVEGIAEYVPLPAFGKPVGYDLEVGDWTAPYGSGNKSDILFQLDGQRTDLSVLFEASLRVTFSNTHDGFVVPERELSGLRVSYLAPPTGYQPTLSKRKTLVEGDTSGVLKGLRKRVEDDVNENYFLRVRTVVDKDGNITSAHYAKVYGGFKWEVSGFVKFQYYFNPTPNDRNLEFDPEKNILTLPKNQQVRDP